jgi:Fic family protein
MDPRKYQNTNAGRVILVPAGYHAFLPNPLPPAIPYSDCLVAMMTDAERALGQMAAQIGSYPYPRILLPAFTRTEAVISSRIEGTQASLLDLYRYETTQLSFFETTDDVREVQNYVRALNYGLERLASLPVSLRFIRELHARLMEGVRGGTLTPGEFRRSQNWIGAVGSTPISAAFVPPPVDDMLSALGDLETFIHGDSSLPALIRIGMIHYQFEAIHPFLDGNGRLGRLLIVLLLYEWGLLPLPLLNLSAYIEHHRQEYYDRLLAVSQKGDWEAWLCFFLRGISEQSRADLSRMAQLAQIRAAYQDWIAQDRKPERLSLVVDFLFTHPIFSLGQLSSALSMPYQTVKRYAEKLLRAKMIREITGQARNRLFQADAVINAIQGGEPHF